MAKQNRRIDHEGPQRAAYEKNRKRILATQEVCAICGRPVDKTKKFPDPMAGVVDHVIPVSRGGHPSDIDNLRLVHNMCNRAKSDKLPGEEVTRPIVSNRDLPLSVDWKNF